MENYFRGILKSDFCTREVIVTFSLTVFGAVVLSLRRWIRGPRIVDTLKKDLTGRVVVITGGNSGIGKETTKYLASLGAKVYILCRNVNEGEKVAQECQGPTEKRVEVIFLDLTSIQSIQECCKELTTRINRIDYLINNAGVMLTGPEKTRDGFDLQFGTNHLGHYLLTDNLMPLILKSAEEGNEPRIVNVSSRAHRWCQDLKWCDINFQLHGTFNSRLAYGQSKMANIIHAKLLARQYGPQGVRAYSLHPGVIPTTNLGRHLKSRFRIIYWILSLTIKPIFSFIAKDDFYGAQTTIFCALDDDLKDQSGSYCSDCKVAEPIVLANVVENQDRLETLSRILLGLPSK